MTDKLPKSILISTVFYALCSHAYAALDPLEECFGQPIDPASEVGLNRVPDFFGQFSNDVRSSRQNSNPKEDGACLISSEIKEFDSAEFLLIDLRRSSPRLGPMSQDIVNMPLHELKTKEYLKKRNLVLIDDRFRYFELLEECKTLIDLGFQRVSVLSGGANIAHKPVEALGSDDFIDAEEFYILKQKWRWLVIDLTHDKYDAVSENLTRIDSGRDGAALSSAIEAFYIKNSFYPNVLILDQDGTSYSRIRNAAKRGYKSRIFYLRNGISGYRKFVLRHNTILAQKQKMQDRGTLPCGASGQH
jgi:hypothetical protein